MNLSRESELDPLAGGQFEFLQTSSSTTDSTATTCGRDSSGETPINGSSTTSVHAIFNLDTGKVMDTIKETRELLNNGATQTPIHHPSKTKQKGKKKKVSASWTAEWSEENYKNERKPNGKLIRFKHFLPL